MLELADLEVNVLEFRQRSFSFERAVELGGSSYAVFSRTETESESRFRPRLIHLCVVVPRGWVVYDGPSDTLRLAKDGGAPLPVPVEPVVEVSAEPSEFSEQDVRWRRLAAPNGTFVYAPVELAGSLLTNEGLAALGVAP